MLLIYKYLYATLFVLVFISCSTDEILEQEYQKFESEIIQSDINTRSTSLQNVSYGSKPEQLFDIYLPEERSNTSTKVFVLIHGGSWTDGDKSNMNDIVTILQNSHPDYAIVNMNYVLADQNNHAFPNQFNDIDLLLNELTANSLEYQIAPEFALIGRSAGGHLALMYDYTLDEQDRVKMVCSFGGPTDFTHSFYQERPNFDHLFDLLVDTEAYPENMNLVRKLSPARRVSYASSPTIIFHGNNDNIVPVQNSKKLKRKLKKKNIPKRLFRLDEGHANWSEETMQFVDTKLSRFINNHFID